MSKRYKDFDLIAIYTQNPTLYFDLIAILRERGIPFISLSDLNDIPSYVNVIITSVIEQNKIFFNNIVAGTDPATLINIALIKNVRKEIKQIVIGIDPGPYPAMSTIVEDKLVDVEQFYEISEIIKKLSSYLTISRNIIVKIGNGDPKYRDRIISRLSGIVRNIVIVDEKNSSKKYFRELLPFYTIEKKKIKTNKRAAIVIGYSPVVKK